LGHHYEDTDALGLISGFFEINGNNKASLVMGQQEVDLQF